MPTMYDKLLQLPLFQGLTLEDFTNILSKVKFHFDNYQPEEVIAREGEVCKRVCFLLDGKVCKTTQIHGAAPLLVQETFAAPYVFELSSLFGKETVYRSTYQATTDASSMSMHKRFLIEELNIYPTIDMNYRNMMSAKVQELSSRLWSTPPESTQGRIAAFILNHVEQPQGRKLFMIQRTHLATYINESFSKTVTTLTEMQQDELLNYDRGVLVIPDAARLVSLL